MNFAVKRPRVDKDCSILLDSPVFAEIQDPEPTCLKKLCLSNDRLVLKPEDLAVLGGEPVDHFGLFLFHIDDVFPLRIFVGRCSRDEG